MTTTTIDVTTMVKIDTTTEAKTKAGKARLIFVLDRSGSMSNIANEAIGGFNAFVEGQKKQPGKAKLSLVIFDNEIDTVHDDVKLSEVPELTNKVYQPRGMTSLFDAIGTTITKTLEKKTSKNEKTILAILTDGEENSSKEFTGQAVADLIKKVETEYNWEVLFLGANIDVSKVATSLNIASHKFASFGATSKGISDTYAAINDVTTMYRSRGVSLNAMSAAEISEFDLTSNLAKAAAASSN